MQPLHFCHCCSISVCVIQFQGQERTSTITYPKLDHLFRIADHGSCQLALLPGLSSVRWLLRTMGLMIVSLESIVIYQLKSQQGDKSQTGYFISDQARLKIGIALLRKNDPISSVI